MKRIVKNTVINKEKSTVTVLCGVVLSFVVFFASCDPGVEYDKIVQNNSDYDVKIYYRADTFDVYKNTSTVIYNYNHIGTVSEYKNCEPIDSITMFVYFGDSIKVIPIAHNMSYWNYQVIKKYNFTGAGICECRMILTNEMLTKW